MRTNDVLVAAIGAAAWGVALVLLLLIGLPDDDRWWLWVCVTGIGIGLFAMWQIPRIQRGRADFNANTGTKAPDRARES